MPGRPPPDPLPCRPCWGRRASRRRLNRASDVGLPLRLRRCASFDSKEWLPAVSGTGRFHAQAEWSGATAAAARGASAAHRTSPQLVSALRSLLRHRRLRSQARELQARTGCALHGSKAAFHACALCAFASRASALDERRAPRALEHLESACDGGGRHAQDFACGKQTFIAMNGKQDAQVVPNGRMGRHGGVKAIPPLLLSIFEFNCQFEPIYSAGNNAKNAPYPASLPPTPHGA